MKAAATKLKKMDVTNIIPAEWNYKKPAENDEYKERFKRSIEEDQSAGVLAVRQVEENVWEAIDGNHRLEAVIELGWTHVHVEDFGEISKAKAILIARRRNYSWFPDDPVELAGLLKEVAEEFSIDEIANFMPDTKDDLENMLKLSDFDWEIFDRNAGDGSEVPEDDGFRTLQVTLPESVYEQWLTWKSKLSEHYQEDMTDAKAIEIAIVEANNLPIETIM